MGKNETFSSHRRSRGGEVGLSLGFPQSPDDKNILIFMPVKNVRATRGPYQYIIITTSYAERVDAIEPYSFDSPRSARPPLYVRPRI